MLIDAYGRRINYLRISLTQRCNFRCLYCMPKVPFTLVPRENLLTYEELFAFAKTCMDAGIDKIRLTGGEPLVRKDLDKFINMLISHKPDLDLALTTNGFLLAQSAQKLASAGLKRINISLDTLLPEIAYKISQKDILNAVITGIYRALEVGLKVKVNAVPLMGINDKELVRLLEFCASQNIQIRFIEFMENTHAYGQLKGVCQADILKLIEQKYELKELEKEPNSPASLYEIKSVKNDYVKQPFKVAKSAYLEHAKEHQSPSSGEIAMLSAPKYPDVITCINELKDAPAGYKFGIINPHKHDFCESCNRIRLSAEGFLIPCLYFDEAMSIKKALRDKDMARALEILKQVLANKPEKNKWGDENGEKSARAFNQTGG